MELKSFFEIGLQYINVVVIKKLQPSIKSRKKTDKPFWNRVMFCVAYGNINRVEFHDETSNLTILVRKYNHRLIDKCDFKKFAQIYTKNDTQFSDQIERHSLFSKVVLKFCETWTLQNL